MIIEDLVKERERYNTLMYKVLNGTLHLKKDIDTIKYPISDEQKQKDIFLYKYYETKYNQYDEMIELEINN